MFCLTANVCSGKVRVGFPGRMVGAWGGVVAVLTDGRTDVGAVLADALDTLCAVDPSLLGDGESITVLHRQLARLEAVVTRAVAAFDAGGEWEHDGARTPAAWIAARCRVPKPAAQSRLRLGRELRQLPHVEAAWLAGTIGAAHAERIGRARTPVTAQVLARDEHLLVDAAARFPFRQFQQVVTYWQQHADPDGTDTDAEQLYQARRLHLSRGLDGVWFLDGCLDPINGTILADALRRIEHHLYQTDWSQARAQTSDTAPIGVTDLARTPAQRRADALVELARRAGAVPPDSRMPEPLFTVLVGYETFAGRICQLADGTVITPAAAARWLPEAWIERIVFDAPDRVINVGVRRRLFTGATRRAIQVRDRECFHPLCDLPADQCQIDHIQPYGQGGLTIETNGRPGCGHHNRQRHHRTEQPP